jgi:hypothetical protein
MLDTKRVNPVGFLLSIIAVAVVIIVTTTPVARPIKSVDQTYALMEQLGLEWNRSGVPVLVFASDGCAASRSLEASLQQEGVVYLRIDVHASEHTEKIHANLGRNYLGTVATRATPTIIVGSRVLRGNNPEKVLKAISDQNER